MPTSERLALEDVASMGKPLANELKSKFGKQIHKYARW
jgi:hypothetical protein